MLETKGYCCLKSSQTLLKVSKISIKPSNRYAAILIECNRFGTGQVSQNQQTQRGFA